MSWLSTLQQWERLIRNYLLSLPRLIEQGDYFAIMASLILLYVVIYLIAKISRVFLMVINRTIAFAITFVALAMVYTKFMENWGTEGLTLETIFIGFIGLVVGILGTMISFFSLFRHTRTAIARSRETDLDIFRSEAGHEEKPEIDLYHIKDYKSFFSLASVKNDKSLLSVLTFLVVAQFGVFSSNTISAPNTKIGVIIFIVFIIVAFLFIKQTYRSYAKGLTHIAVTFVLGVMLAFVLGYYWANIPVEKLFSLEVFTTDVLVALVSGMGLSLFAGSKG